VIHRARGPVAEVLGSKTGGECLEVVLVLVKDGEIDWIGRLHPWDLNYDLRSFNIESGPK
jgi:hypothetical protein